MDNLLPLLDNKVYDFNLESIRNSTRDDFGPGCQVKYDPDAKSEIFDQFIKDFTLGRKDIENCLQEFSGMALMGNRSLIFKKFLRLYGGGSNGKTVLLNTLTKIIQYYTISQPSELNYDMLISARLLIINESETEKQEMTNKSFVKKLIGGDSIYSQKDSCNVNHGCRVVMVSNTKDDFGEDNIIRNRCIYVPCLMEAVTNPTESHQRKLDINLSERLNDPYVLSAILNWLIEGALRFKRQGFVTEPKL